MPVEKKPKSEPKEKLKILEPNLLFFNIDKTFKNAKFDHFNVSMLILILEMYKQMLVNKRIPAKKKKLIKVKYNAYLQKVKPYSIKILKSVKNDWVTKKLTLKTADETMRKLWLISDLSIIIGKPYKTLCLKMISQIDQWIIKKVKDNPIKSKLGIQTSISNLMKLKKISNKPNIFEEKIDLSKIIDHFESILVKGKRMIMFNDEIWDVKITGLDGIALINEKNKKIFIVIPHKELMKLIKNRKFSEIFARAKKNYEKEKAQKSKLEKFDLPKDKKGAYLRFFPSKSDDVIASTLQSSGIKAAVLNHRYPNLKTKPIIFADNFKKALYSNIKKAYDQGTRFFYIDVYNHGEKKGLGFKALPNAQDIANIIKKFPDAKFVFNTIACYVGCLRKGFLKAMQLDPKLKKQISVFLQTKPDLVNLVSIVKKPDLTKSKQFYGYSTYYQLFLIKALQEGKTYGQAAVYADQESKKHMYLNPEAIIGGELFVKLEKIRKQKASNA
jgi:hypothetical protein